MFVYKCMFVFCVLKVELVMVCMFVRVYVCQGVQAEDYDLEKKLVGEEKYHHKSKTRTASGC